MISIEMQKDFKGEPTGQLIIFAKNPTTGAAINYRRVGDNGIFIQPEGLLSLLASLKKQEKEINILTKAYANGKTFKITIKEFGDDITPDNNPDDDPIA